MFHSYLAQCKKALGDTKGALQAADKSLVLNPNSVTTRQVKRSILTSPDLKGPSDLYSMVSYAVGDMNAESLSLGYTYLAQGLTAEAFGYFTAGTGKPKDS